MARKKIWTAQVVCHFGGILIAQCKSSKAELIRRVLADDSVWHRGMTLFIGPMLPNRRFRRGLVIDYSPPVKP